MKATQTKQSKVMTKCSRSQNRLQPFIVGCIALQETETLKKGSKRHVHVSTTTPYDKDLWQGLALQKLQDKAYNMVQTMIQILSLHRYQ